MAQTNGNKNHQQMQNSRIHQELPQEGSTKLLKCRQDQRRYRDMSFLPTEVGFERSEGTG